MRFLKSKPLRLGLAVAALAAALGIGYALWGQSLRTWLDERAQSADAGGHGHPHGGHGHAHGEDEPIESVTVWTEKAEVFLERPYAIRAHGLKSLVHLTVLKTGAPLNEGTVTLVGTGPAGGEFSTDSSKPTRPGIYTLKAFMRKAGTYQLRLVIESPELDGGGDAVELPPMVVYEDHAEAEKAAERAATEPGEEIEFLKEQQWRVQMSIGPGGRHDLAERLAVPGKVIAPHPSEAMVPPPVAGKVLPPPDGHFPHFGQVVKEGDVLAVIEPSVVGGESVQMLVNQAQLQALDAELGAKQLDAETKVKAAQLDLALADSNLKRLQDLAERRIVAGKERLVAQNEYDQAQARLQGWLQLVDTYVAARERLSQFTSVGGMNQVLSGQREGLHVVLRSPIDGTIVEADATAGEFVNHDHPLFHVINLERLFIEAYVSEYDIARAERAAMAGYRLSAYPEEVTPILGSGGGRLVSVGALVDPQTRTLAIRYEVPNPRGRLRVGMFAEVLIETNPRPQVLAVPLEAIVDDGGEPVVYVQTGGESFVRRPVVLGLRDVEYVEIKSGLQTGERIAKSNAYLIRLSTLAGGAPQHHHH